MKIQFRCPGCELLEADESEAGQVVVCPFCDRELEVPEVGEVESAEQELPQIHRRGAVKIDVAPPVETHKPKGPIGVDEPDLYHITCPQGFVMEVPRDMLGQTALCPCCRTKLVLNLRDTIEFRRKRALEEQVEQTKLGKFWLHLAIVIGVLVVSGVLLMFLIEVFKDR